MATSSYRKAPSFLNYLGQGDHDLQTDTVKLYLAASGLTSSVAYTKYHATTASASILTEFAEGTGSYTGGGADIGNTWNATGSGYELACTSSMVFTASDNAWAGFRLVGIYNASTATTAGDALTHELVGYWDYGSVVTLTSGDTFTVTFTGSRVFAIGAA